MIRRLRSTAFAVSLAITPTAAAAVLAVACGSRTGLPELGSLPADDGTDGQNQDAASDAGAVRDVGRDGPLSDLPLIDAAPRRDASRTNCADGEGTVVYLMTSQNQLFSYDPASGAFARRGTIACPDTRDANPFSMAVDSRGVAHVLFNDGRLFRVSTANAACTTTPFAPNQEGFDLFGMGYAASDTGDEETLYLAHNAGVTPTDPANPSSSRGLARLPVGEGADYRVARIGQFDRPVERAELTGTGDGRLFAFYLAGENDSPVVAQFDKTTARVVAATPVPVPLPIRAFAFAQFGGDFYIFTARESLGASEVRRFRPADNTTTLVGRLGATIVGAGVSTCAPL